jgi:hypothetical protein
MNGWETDGEGKVKFVLGHGEGDSLRSRDRGWGSGIFMLWYSHVVKEGVIVTVGLELCGNGTVKRSEIVKWWSTDYIALLHFLQVENQELCINTVTKSFLRLREL